MNYIYKPEHRGLCSILNSVIGFCDEQSLGDKKTIYIDSTGSPYFKTISFYDVFETNEVIIDSVTGDEIPISEQHARKLAVKKYQPSTKTILNYTLDVHKEIESVVSELNLPKSFACFHIRRGDKVGEKLLKWKQKTRRIESKRFEFCDYLKHCKNIETIFIMTDDYRCIQEAHKHINSNNLPHNILYLTNESQSGHSETLNIQNDRRYSKQELVQFFSEIEIAKQSQQFIGTKSSNIFRYIRKQCVKDVEFISLD